MSMVVLEGPNSVGKSTICEWGETEFGVPRFHWNPNYAASEQAWTDATLNEWGNKGAPAIFDRFFLTGIVYPAAGMKKYQGVSPYNGQEYIDATLARIEALRKDGALLLIQARLPFERLMASEIKQNPAHREAEQDFYAIWKGYEDLFEARFPDRHIYNFEDEGSLVTTRQLVREFIERHR